MTRFATFCGRRSHRRAGLGCSRRSRSRCARFERAGLTAELLLDSETYQSRKLTSVTLPGALVREMSFTL